MIKISQDQVYERWDLLTEDLRWALVSDVNADFIQKACRAEYIPEEKMDRVSRIIGMVLYGFLHPEDMASEIANDLNIDPRIAASLSTAINQRIFVPLRSQIDAFYAPPGSQPADVMADGPKIIIEDANSATPISSPVPLKANPIVPISKPVETIVPHPSVAVSAQAFVDASSIIPAPQKIGAGAMPMPLENKPAPIPAPKPSLPDAPKPAAVPSPFIMRDDSMLKPLAKASDFHVASDDKLASASPLKSVVPPPRPVVLEFANQKMASLPPKPAARVVNIPQPPTPQKGREISEITGSAAVPNVPLPPKPNSLSSLPPKPPAPPVAPVPLPPPMPMK